MNVRKHHVSNGITINQAILYRIDGYLETWELKLSESFLSTTFMALAASKFRVSTLDDDPKVGGGSMLKQREDRYN